MFLRSLLWKVLIFNEFLLLGMC